MRHPVLAGAAVVLGAVALSVGYWWPALRDPWATGFGDWQYIHHMWEAGRVAIERHGELPLWDPWHCGGITLWGNPENQTWSPLFYLSLLMGSTLALKVHLVVHCAAGLLGMWVLARREYGLGVPAAALAAIAWGLSGTFAWDGAGGHSTFLAFWLAPWVIWAWRRAALDPRWCALVAALLAMILLDGGTYPLPFQIALLAFDTGVQLTDRTRRAGVVRAALIAAPLAVLLGAVRIVPILLTLRRYPREVIDTDSLGLPDVLQMLVARDHPWRVEGHEYVWAEYGAFVGWIVVVLIAAGAVIALRVRGRRHLLVGLCFFGLCMVGYASKLHPWPLLKHLPVFDSLRVPSRFAVYFLLYGGLLAGLALQRAGEWLQSVRLPRAVAAMHWVLPMLVVVAATADIFEGTRVITQRWSGPPIVTTEPYGRYHLVPGHDYGEIYAGLPQRDRGTAACYPTFPWPVARGLWTGDVPQARIEAQRGEVTGWGRTAITAWAEIRLERAARVTFDQTWAPGWISSVGTAGADDQGRLVVDAPLSARRIDVRYQPEELPWAIAASTLGVVLAILCALRLRREPLDRLQARLRSALRPGRGR